MAPPASVVRHNPTATFHSANAIEDICPVCKSNRYLNPSLTFLLNSDCYHIMCTSCVDRLFTSGPAPCPVAGCHKTLKKRGFHKAFFQDLGIEREVDIRRRVMQVFNKRQEDFETLGDWNNYLESVEDLVFKITDGTPPEKEEAEQALKEYAEMNRREIEENLRAEREEEETAREAARAAEERAKARREQMRRQDEKDRNDIQKIRKQALEAMGSGGDAEEIKRRAEKLILVKKEARRKLDEEKPVAIRGLKKRKEKVIDLPYDPFGGLYSEPTRFVLQDRYPNDFLKHAENDMRHMAGGYSLQEYYQRSLFDAMAGLAIFIGEEKEQERAAQREPQVSLPDRTMQDVF